MIENDVYIGFLMKVKHGRSMYNLVTGDMKLLLVSEFGIGIGGEQASKVQRLHKEMIFGETKSLQRGKP